MIDERATQLLAEFGPEDIKVIKKAGRGFDYLKHAAVTRRLIEVFGCEWSFELVETRIEAEELAVLGRLSVGGVARMAWGGCRRDRGMDLDDALKSAGSFALKKSASLWGVGLHLWEDPVVEDSAPQRRSESKDRAVPAPQPAQVAAKPVRRAAPASDAQHTELVRLAKAQGWGREQYERWLADFCGLVGDEELTYPQAAKALEYLRSAKPATDAPVPLTKEQGDRLRELCGLMGWPREEIGYRCHRAMGVRPSALTADQAARWIELLTEELRVRAEREADEGRAS
jgi:hypothetical protein